MRMDLRYHHLALLLNFASRANSRLEREGHVSAYSSCRLNRSQSPTINCFLSPLPPPLFFFRIVFRHREFPNEKQMVESDFFFYWLTKLIEEVLNPWLIDQDFDLNQSRLIQFVNIDQHREKRNACEVCMLYICVYGEGLSISWGTVQTGKIRTYYTVKSISNEMSDPFGDFCGRPHGTNLNVSYDSDRVLWIM